MYRARIPLLAAGFMAVLTVVAWMSAHSTLTAAAQDESARRVERAQATLPSLDRLRAIDLVNETARFAREDELGAVFDQKSTDEQRKAAFLAVSARNARLESAGHKADLVAVLGANGHVVARDLNIEVLYDEDLKARYPIVGKALAGTPTTDVWSFDGRMYRAAAAPIFRAGAVAGALVIGYAASASDAAADHDHLGVDVAYFLDGKIHASSLRRLSGGSATEKALAGQLFDGARLAAGGAHKPAPIKLNGEEYLAAVGPLSDGGLRVQAGFVVLTALGGNADFGTLAFLTWMLGIAGLLIAVGAAVMTALRFLRPLDRIESGVAEVINGNRDYTFDSPSPDFEGLANGLNVMLARLTGRPDPGDDELGAAARWSGELSVDAQITGPHMSPEHAALADEPEEAYLRRIFEEYLAARKATNENVDGLVFDGFVQKVRQNEAALKSKYNARSVRFKVVVKNGQTTLKPVPIV